MSNSCAPTTFIFSFHGVLPRSRKTTLLTSAVYVKPMERMRSRTLIDILPKDAVTGFDDQKVLRYAKVSKET